MQKNPETVVTMDLTCSICSDGSVLSNPLDEYLVGKHGGGNKKTRKTMNKRRTYR